MLTTSPRPRTSAMPVREQILAFLFQHRAVDTFQLHRMLYPRPRPRTDHMRRCLRQLQRDGLVKSIARAYHPSLWALSGAGRAEVARWPYLSAGRAAGRTSHPGCQRSVHALAVTSTFLAFLDDARTRGDEFTPLDWQPEVAHPLDDGAADGDRVLIPDALMHYTCLGDSHGPLRAFVEVDRATEPQARLAAKLIAYARFYYARPAEHGNLSQPVGAPVWHNSYPHFPRVLFVLNSAGPRAAQRIADLQAMARQHPLVSALAAEVPLGVSALEELEEQGASAPVWRPLTGCGQPQSWMDL